MTVKNHGANDRLYRSNTAVKDRIIQLLGFPRTLVRESIDHENCTHAGNFAPGDPVCADCASRLECRWLYHNDEFSALGEKPEAKLVEALEFALDYVEAFAHRAGHRPSKRCPCEVCAWLKGARELRRQADLPS